MKFGPTQIGDVTSLAALRLEDEERIVSAVKEMLCFFDKMAEVDLEALLPTDASSAFTSGNCLRGDLPRLSENGDSLTLDAPRFENGYYVVQGGKKR